MTPRPLPTRPRPQTSRGAALLTALVIVTLVTTVATAMIWQQWRAIQVEVAERTQVQAQMVLNGALDWARLLLREDYWADARKNRGAGDYIDTLSEIWATPLSEAKLSTFLAADKDQNSEDAPDAFLSGSISDAQARFNLRNLVRNNQASVPDEKALRRLCEFVNVPARTCDALITSTQQAILITAPPAPAAAGGTGGAVSVPASAPAIPKSAALLPQVTSDLGWLGVDRINVRRLLPHVVILPNNTPINLNTAGKEVIAAMIPGLDLASAQRLIQARQQRPLRSSGDLRAVIGAATLSDIDNRFSYQSNYFEVIGTLRLDEMIVSQRSMLRRQGPNLFILTTERIGPGAATPPTPTNAPH